MPKSQPVIYQNQLKTTASAATELETAALKEACRGRFVKDHEENLFFLKQVSVKEAEEEVLFSRLYQLDIGDSAASNYFLAKADDHLGVASKALPSFVDYKSLFAKKNRKLFEACFHLNKQGQPTGFKMVKGLAPVLMSAWLYGEDDLHRRNFGVYQDAQGELCWGRIDFGRSLPDITNHKRPLRSSSEKGCEISLARLQQFPAFDSQAPFYWPTSITGDNHYLNIRGQRKGNAYGFADRRLFLTLAEQDSHRHEGDEAWVDFKREKNAFLLRLWLAPISLKRKLILEGVDDSEYADRLAFNVESRIIQMRWAALSDADFVAYLSDVLQQGLSSDNLVAGSEFAVAVQAIEANAAAVSSAMIARDTLLKKAARLANKLPQLSQRATVEPPPSPEFEVLFHDVLTEKDWLLSELKRASLRKALDNKLSDVLIHNLQHGNVQQANKLLHLYLSFRQAISPVINLITLSRDRDLKQKLKCLGEEWIIPAFSLLAEKCSGDRLFQHQLIKRSRNIEQLIRQLGEQGKISETINALLGEVTKLDNITAEAVNQKLSEIEQRLLSSSYEHQFTWLSEPRQRFDTSFSIMNDCINYSQELLKGALPAFITNAVQGAKSVLQLNDHQIIRSLSLMQTLLQNLHSELENQRLHQHSQQYKKLARRMQRMLATHALEKKSRQQYCQTMRDALLSINVLLSRFYLDVICEKKRQQYLSDGEGCDNALLQTQLNAAMQLSLALAKPDYHDTLSRHDVALAGVMGAELLTEPSLSRAQHTLRFSHYLANSHQVRLKTKVALSLAILGALTLCAGIALLCPPLAVAALSVAVPVALIAAGGTLMSAGGGFATYRFLRDKNKVHRKLDELSHASELIVDRHEPNT